MKRALGLVELIVAVVIIGILAALAIPQFTRAAPGSEDQNVRGNLNVLRFAIELYYQEHGAYPAQRGDGQHEAGTVATFASQLTKFTDEQGSVSDTKDATHRFGPYLRLGIPPCPVSPRAGKTGVALVTVPPAYQESMPDAGWVYNFLTGDVALNSNATDSSGLSYDEY